MRDGSPSDGAAKVDADSLARARERAGVRAKTSMATNVAMARKAKPRDSLAVSATKPASLMRRREADALKTEHEARNIK